MGKAIGAGSIIFGVIMVLLGIGAYFSGEASSETDQGRMAIGIVIILGLLLIYGGVSAKQKEDEKAKAAQQAAQAPQAAQMGEPLPPPPPPDTVSTAFCSDCGRAVQPDFVACPYCGIALGGPKG